MGNFDFRRSRSGHHKAIASAVAFLRGVGIDVVAAPAPPGCFFPGVWFVGPRICYDPRVAHVGDLLHEAGHLAVLPAQLRASLTEGSLEANPVVDERRRDLLEIAMLESITADPDMPPRDRALQLMINADEHAAVAWSYAAALAAEVDPGRVLEIVTWFQAGKGRVRDGGRRVRVSLFLNRHPGVRALADAGMTTVEGYPEMSRWLQV